MAVKIIVFILGCLLGAAIIVLYLRIFQIKKL